MTDTTAHPARRQSQMSVLQQIAVELGATTTRVFQIEREGGRVVVYWEGDILGTGETREEALLDALASAIDINAFAEGSVPSTGTLT